MEWQCNTRHYSYLPVKKNGVLIKDFRVVLELVVPMLEMGVNALREQPSADLLDLVYHRKSTDPRDKIFALVELAYLRGIRFQVDYYTQSMREISKRLLDECRESLIFPVLDFYTLHCRPNDKYSAES